MESPITRKVLAEAIGTFLLVFIGTGAVVTNTVNPASSSGLLAIAVAFGFALMLVVYTVGHISGAHVNPAVTLGLAITGKIPARDAVLYAVAQVIGAFVASIVLRIAFGNVADLGTTLPSGGNAESFTLELILTAVLVFVVYGVATDKRAPAAAAGLAIGSAVLLNVLVAGPISGGSINPARSLAPAVVSGNFDGLWIYLIAPFIGGVVGALAYTAIRGSEESRLTAEQGTTTEPHRTDVAPADR